MPRFTRKTLVSAVFLCLLGASRLPAGVVISEFLASNANGISDEDGDESDWIEILNDSTTAIDLLGWRLTDETAIPEKWSFPARTLQPGETLLVFASQKDRKPASGNLHTNFKLNAAGEYLGLANSVGTIVHEFAPGFPIQVADVSYGLPSDNRVVYADQGAACEVGVPTSQADYDTNFADWKTSTATFTGTSWQARAHTGIGYDDPGAPYGSLVGPGGDIKVRLDDFQSTACLRVRFTVDNPAAVDELKLRMKWDDGFAAFINGTPVADDLAPASQTWNANSTGNRTEALNNDWTDFIIPASGVTLAAGDNILAIHGFNRTANSSDFLLLPILEGTLLTSGGALPPTWFTSPTPGAPNSAGGDIGPSLDNPVATIPRPTGNGSSPDQVLTVEVTETIFPVAAVHAYHRTMFGPETLLTMHDDGVSPDAVADDGVYSASLPTTGPQPGGMLRWRFEALDDQGNTGRVPAFSDPDDSDEYFGTAALDADTDTSQLPVFHWFIENPTGGDSRAGTRASFFFLGNFYDNIEINLHGQSTAGFGKKSYDIDFNRGNRFHWKEGEGRVKDINLLTNYADRTKTRNTLTHEMGMLAGTVSHFAFPVRVEQNGNFHGIWDMLEDADDRMLERNGLDPDGAFYKMYNKLTSSSSGIEKKTRTEEGNGDLATLIAGLDPAQSITTRRTYGYDHVNLPATINYLVTRQFNSDRDHGHKNYFLYRDTEITGEWRPIIWDVDLSQGHNWVSGPGYFDDTLYWNNPLNAGIADNRLYSLVYGSPELRAMFLRRMRTLMDEVLQPPGTINGMMETRMREIAATVDPDPANPSAWTDGDRDFSKWGTWGVGLHPREEVERVVSGYLQPRRSFLFDQGSSRPRLGGDPIPDTRQVNAPGLVGIDAIDYLPASNNQQEEYIQLRNLTSTAVDLSGWTLSGAIDHVFEGGTVIPAGAGTSAVDYQGLLHVVKNATAFRSRNTAPAGGRRRLIQGNYSGQLSARGETIELRDASGQLIDSLSYAGTPTVVQQSLRISEISYNPAPPTPAELASMPELTGADFEFIEFTNIGPATINVVGAHFTNGIQFTFGTVGVHPGNRLVLARNPAALALRYGSLSAPVTGPYLGSLNGAGERIELVDGIGEVILDFRFKDGWYPATDGPGRTLVARDPAGTPTTGFGEAEVWGISMNPNGTPGDPDPLVAQAYFGWDNFHFTSLERADPLVGGPDADPDGDGWTNLLEYALGGDPWIADTSLIDFAWATDGSNAHAAVRHLRPSNAIDLSYELLATDDPSLATWPPVSTVEHSSTPAGPGLEDVVTRESSPAPAGPRFLRIKVSLLP